LSPLREISVIGIRPQNFLTPLLTALMKIVTYWPVSVTLLFMYFNVTILYPYVIAFLDYFNFMFSSIPFLSHTTQNSAVLSNCQIIELVMFILRCTLVLWR